MSKKVLFILLMVTVLLVVKNVAMAEIDNKIAFNDKNLQHAISKFYGWNDVFTKEKAKELSKKEDNLFLDYSNINDLEGLQYFENLVQVNLRGNILNDLSVLSKMKYLSFIDISYNAISGKKIEGILERMRKIENLNMIFLMNNKISNLNFLSNIGNINKYNNINMEENQISDISILKKATKLKRLDLSDNRITDVTSLEKLDKLTFYLDLRDNCIINYKPIKPLLDKMFSDPGNETGLERYDYDTNPVNFKYNGKTIKFPYYTSYYKYQAYAEAIPLFKALGGSARYNKKIGTLTCNYDGKVLVLKDFSEKYTLNGKDNTLKYPMRRMQYDLAYIPVKDICEVLGLNYKVTKKRVLSNDDKVFARPPKNVDISK